MPVANQTRNRPDLDRAAIRKLERRIVALERRLAPRRTGPAPPPPWPHFDLRMRIIEEDTLRRELEGDQAWRRDSPDLWRRYEQQRRASNRAKAVLNQRLHGAGLGPVALEPSLKQRMQKLKRLEARNLAETARIRT